MILRPNKKNKRPKEGSSFLPGSKESDAFEKTRRHLMKDFGIQGLEV